MLEEFRALVRAGILRVTPENEVLSTKEAPNASGGSEEPPTAGSREEDVALLDRQLLEWLERKRQQETDERRKETPRSPGQTQESLLADLKQNVVERLAQKILDVWDRADQGAEGYPLLRDQVAERMTDEILRRWQRGSE